MVKKLWVLATWGALQVFGPPAQTPDSVKAEFIQRFTQFVEWPAEALAPDGGPFVLCTAGEDPMVGRLAQTVSRQAIRNHPVQLRVVHHNETAEGCHLLYIAPSEQPRVARLLEQTRGKPVLSVSDTQGFGEEGVLINLFIDAESHVRFEINAVTAKASGLKISAKLMALARAPKSRGE